MKCTITRKNNLPTSVWSGGSTIQLFIHPLHSSYAARDFEVRISSATVETETSIFTDLPGYHRILMPLNAPLKLVFEEHGEVLLNPFEATEFEGAWHTVSHGVCTDLGVMLAEGWHGSLEPAGSGKYECRPGFTGIYSLTDNLMVSVKGNGETLSDILMQGDFLLLESQTDAKLVLKAPSADTIVLIRVIRMQ